MSISGHALARTACTWGSERLTPRHPGTVTADHAFLNPMAEQKSFLMDEYSRTNSG